MSSFDSCLLCYYYYIYFQTRFRLRWGRKGCLYCSVFFKSVYLCPCKCMTDTHTLTHTHTHTWWTEWAGGRCLARQRACTWSAWGLRRPPGSRCTNGLWRWGSARSEPPWPPLSSSCNQPRRKKPPCRSRAAANKQCILGGPGKKCMHKSNSPG